MTKKAYIYTSVICLFSCLPNSNQELPVTQSEIFNTFIRAAPVSRINLDEVAIHEVYLEDDNILYSVARDFDISSGELQLSSPVRLVEGSNHLYVYDFNSPEIVEMTRNGRITRTVTREGRGPGEINRFSSTLIANDEIIMINDFNNGRLNVYDHHFSYLESIDIQIPGLDRISISNDRMIHQNQMSSGLFPVDPSQGLLLVRSIMNVSDTLATLIPRLVPVGHQPGAFNSLQYSMNSNNKVLAGYRPLPWLFLFGKDFSHQLSILLEAAAFDSLNTPPLEFFPVQDHEGFRVSIPISRFDLLDNDQILVSCPIGLIHLVPNSDGNYEAVKIYRFISRYHEGYSFPRDIQQSRSSSSTFYIIGTRDLIFKTELPLD